MVRSVEAPLARVTPLPEECEEDVGVGICSRLAARVDLYPVRDDRQNPLLWPHRRQLLHDLTILRVLVRQQAVELELQGLFGCHVLQFHLM